MEKNVSLEPVAIDNPSSVLFVCNFNSVRSPMAEAIAKYYCGHKIFVDSVGVHEKVEAINPFTVSVMEEIGIDISKHHHKNFDDLNDNSFDLVVTLSPEAHHRALDLTRFLSTQVEYWPTMDPTTVKGSRENIMDAFRLVRNSLEEKIKKRLSVTSSPVV